MLGGGAALLLLAVRDGAVMTGLWWRVAIHILDVEFWRMSGNIVRNRQKLSARCQNLTHKQWYNDEEVA